MLSSSVISCLVIEYIHCDERVGYSGHGADRGDIRCADRVDISCDVSDGRLNISCDNGDKKNDISVDDGRRESRSK